MPDQTSQNPSSGDPQNDAPGIPPVTKKPQDMSQYIRTYAKDVAMLTNQPPPKTAPIPASDREDRVVLPEVDASPVNRPGGSAHEFPQEQVALSKDDSEGIFERAPSAAPAAPPEPSEEEKRSAILARLREKALSAPPLPPPTEALPSYETFAPIFRPIPSDDPEPMPPMPEEFITRTPEYVAPPPPMRAPEPAPPPSQPLREPAPQPLPPSPPPSEEPAPFHTFTSDFADRIDEQKASTFSVLAAQQDARPVNPVLKSNRRTPLLPAILAMLLILFGAGGLYAAYKFTSKSTAPTETLGVPSLVFADEKMELQGPDYAQALADAANQPLVQGNVLITYVTDATSTSLGLRNVPQEGGVLIRLIRFNAPDILLRNVDLSSTVGIIAAGNETRPFFIMRVNSFERTFAGMLGWESRMQDDLARYYPPYAELAPVQAAASTTASTTIATSPAGTNGQFVDAVVANHDVRVLRDSFGRSLILYGYSDKQTLIIARNEEAFTALAARLAATH